MLFPAPLQDVAFKQPDQRPTGPAPDLGASATSPTASTAPPPANKRALNPTAPRPTAMGICGQPHGIRCLCLPARRSSSSSFGKAAAPRPQQRRPVAYCSPGERKRPPPHDSPGVGVLSGGIRQAVWSHRPQVAAYRTTAPDLEFPAVSGWCAPSVRRFCPVPLASGRVGTISSDGSAGP